MLLSAPLAGERLGWPHLTGALLGLAGVALLAISRGVSFHSIYALGYALALGCAFAWSLYSVLSRRFGETPTDAIASFCAAAAALSLVCHLLFEHTVWPSTPAAWLAVLALGIGPTGGAFYLWDHAVKRGDIRALGALSYAAPILSTALLIACGLAQPTSTLLFAAPPRHCRRGARLARDVAALDGFRSDGTAARFHLNGNALLQAPRPTALSVRLIPAEPIML